MEKFLAKVKRKSLHLPEMQSRHSCFHMEAPHGKELCLSRASAKQGHALAKPFPGHKNVHGP